MEHQESEPTEKPTQCKTVKAVSNLRHLTKESQFDLALSLARQVHTSEAYPEKKKHLDTIIGLLVDMLISNRRKRILDCQNEQTALKMAKMLSGTLQPHLVRELVCSLITDSVLFE